MTISQINKNLEDNNTTKYNNENYHNNIQIYKKIIFFLFQMI